MLILVFHTEQYFNPNVFWNDITADFSSGIRLFNLQMTVYYIELFNLNRTIIIYNKI